MTTHNTKLNHTFCTVCDGTVFQPYKFGLVQCGACRVVLSPSIWQPQANEQFEEEWFGSNYQAVTSFWVVLFESWNNRKTLARLDQANPPGCSLLEIGIGSGSFLNDARNRGYEVMGCDLSASISNQVRHNYGINIHCGMLEDLVDKHFFDVIVLNHVLEHVQHPIDFIKVVDRLLVPGGVVHCAVPNCACWEAHFSGWTSYEPYHLVYFDRKTLNKSVSAGGLLVVQTITHDSFSGWFLAILRTVMGINSGGAVERHSSPTAVGKEGRRSRLIEHIYRLTMVCFGSLILPLRWIQAKLGYGDEIICIASKPKASSMQPEVA